MDEKPKPNYYAIIPATVRYDNDLTANAKLLYGELTALTNEKGYCWATNKYFSNLYTTSERTVQRWIKDLAAKQYIEIKFIYKPNSKEIQQRYIYIRGDKNVAPHDKNVTTPHDKNVADNTTYNLNNTLNNSICSFDEFWYLYPKKLSKKEAAKSWVKLKVNELLFNDIINGLRKAIKSHDWTKDNGKFIPYPATWLNGERWTDEVVEYVRIEPARKQTRREESMSELERMCDEFDRCRTETPSQHDYRSIPGRV